GSNAGSPSYATPTDYTGNVSGTLKAYMLVNDVTQLQAMNTNVTTTGVYALGRDIDASATSGWNGGLGFNPVGTYGGNASNYFNGTFDGLGHTVRGLTINRSTTGVGLF